MNIQKDFSEFAEDCLGNDYEKADMLSDYFGIDKSVVVQILILKELQELNRILYNTLEARR